MFDCFSLLILFSFLLLIPSGWGKPAQTPVVSQVASFPVQSFQCHQALSRGVLWVFSLWDCCVDTWFDLSLHNASCRRGCSGVCALAGYPWYLSSCSQRTLADGSDLFELSIWGVNFAGVSSKHSCMTYAEHTEGESFPCSDQYVLQTVLFLPHENHQEKKKQTSEKIPTCLILFHFRFSACVFLVCYDRAN